MVIFRLPQHLKTLHGVRTDTDKSGNLNYIVKKSGIGLYPDRIGYDMMEHDRIERDKLCIQLNYHFNEWTIRQELVWCTLSAST